ncbi:A24 family peptidase [Metallumcola ferriviriculae]|uniref:A24 family peptidase n=1 Tax=Metallumcola ferriviriculae TaxID=3039180 RepID=A0AAU0UM94_9FIRM|nr:A24 family peptidase [Desulfitibacteraceae bacterium MK1]
MYQVLVTLLIVLTCTFWDIKEHRIPNKVTLPAIVFGIILNSYLNSWLGLRESIFGAALGIGPLLIPFIMGVIGGGDVKLLAAVGAINGVDFVIWAFLYSALAGGVMALSYSLIKGQLRVVISNITFTTTSYILGIKNGSGTKGLVFAPSGLYLPYAVAILVGTLATYALR